MVVGSEEISRSTVYSRSGFQVMVGTTKSIVSRSREIERENSMVGGWDANYANSLSSRNRRSFRDEPRPSRTLPDKTLELTVSVEVDGMR
jgi:hypothetical protein